MLSLYGYKHTHKIASLYSLTSHTPWPYRSEFLFSCMQLYSARDVVTMSCCVMTMLDERSYFDALYNTRGAETAISAKYRSK